MSVDPHRPPPLVLEKLRAGELSAESERKLRERFGTALLNRELDELEHSNAALRMEAVSAPMIAGIQERLERVAHRQPGGRVLRLSFAVAPALAAAAAVWFSVTVPSEPGNAQLRTAEPLEITRLKGDDPATLGAGQLLIYRRTAKADSKEPDSPDPEIEQLVEGAQVSAGDVLQMGYATHLPFGALLSLDGRGQVTLHSPADASAKPKLSRREALLGFSYELDDSPHFERFFFVASAQSFSVRKVVAAAKALGATPKQASTAPLTLPKGLKFTSLSLKKVSQ